MNESGLHGNDSDLISISVTNPNVPCAFFSLCLGNYLYFEASSPAAPGQTTCFFSQEFPGGSCQRLTFWYHMLGSGIGKLTVQIKNNDGTGIVWEKSGEQGDKWLQASVEIMSNLPYKVSRIVLNNNVIFIFINYVFSYINKTRTYNKPTTLRALPEIERKFCFLPFWNNASSFCVST